VSDENASNQQPPREPAGPPPPAPPGPPPPPPAPEETVGSAPAQETVGAAPTPVEPLPPPPGASLPPAPAYGTPPTGGDETFGTAPPPPAAPPKKSPVGKILGIVGGVLALLLVLCAIGVFFVVRNVQGGLANAKTGDCVADFTPTQSVTETKAKKVDCGDASATYKVLGVVKNVSRTEFETGKPCADYPTTNGALWLERGGTVLCMEPVQK
jgi:hypothetical protein